jgi:ArsR family transcriptional regulator
MRNGGNKANLEYVVYERQASICKAFSHPIRLHLLDLLGKGELGVSELQKRVGISRTNLSQHLAILKSAGVIATRRSGKNMYYYLTIPEVTQACHLIRKVLLAQIASDRRLAAASR